MATGVLDRITWHAGREPAKVDRITVSQLQIRCPWCSSVQDKVEALLGRLGRLTHFRCRYCGGQFSKAVR